MSNTAMMDKRWLISQAELEAWLDGIAAARDLVAPCWESGNQVFRPISASNEISWNQAKSGPALVGRPIMSLKELYFPPTERLFSIRKAGQEIELEESYPEWEAIVFGVRPCDAHGMKLLDATFIDTIPVDSFYTRRRRNTTLIGLACAEMGKTCFCTSVGIKPNDAHDMDIMLYPVDGNYIVEAITEKGRYLIPAGVWNETKAEQISPDEKAQFPIPGKHKWSDQFNNAYWKSITERCLSCRACAYVCPSCRCFTVIDDEIRPGEFERIRCWDACAGENYRRVAGGHRPRAEKSERLRNRLFCKFSYFPEQYSLGNASACTGCGRCIDVCPVGVDLTEVLKDLESFL